MYVMKIIHFNEIGIDFLKCLHLNEIIRNK